MQVVKDPLKTKGARLSMDLTIAGRYMVYTPTGEGVGVSKRLDDKERERLRKEARGLDLRGGGAIVRTAASGAKRADFERELQYLFKLHEVLQKRVEEATRARARLPGGRPLGPRRARHLLGRLRARARRRREAVPPPGVVLHADRRPSWSTASSSTRTPRRCSRPTASRTSSRALISRRVDLPSGGYLMIDYAEALTVIDVNSGSFVGRGKQARLEDTITRTNLEAAEAVVNELRLRDIGGIIVIDFIDMARARNRDAVLKTLRKSLDEDRTKTFTAEISKLGLVEMTRQNVTEGVREIMTRAVPVVRRRRRRALRGDDRHRVRAPPARAGCARPAQDRGLPHPHAPARELAVHGQRGARAARAGGRDRHALPLQGLRGAAPRPLRHRARGLRRGRARAGDPVPGGRRGARHHRRAAHVRGRRRRGQGRRLHHLGHRRRPPTWARSASCASRRPGARRPPRCSSRASRCRATEPGRAAAKSAARRSRPRRPARDEEKPAPRKRVRTTRPKPTPKTEAEVEDEPAADGEDKAASDGDDVESTPRRRGRRGGRRRSAAKAEATSD